MNINPVIAIVVENNAPVIKVYPSVAALESAAREKTGIIHEGADISLNAVHGDHSAIILDEDATRERVAIKFQHMPEKVQQDISVLWDIMEAGLR